jgi:hypothetical protein
MLHPGQTDLSREGYIFSGVMITLINLAFILLLLSLLAPDWKRSGWNFLLRAQECYLWTGREIADGFAWAVKTLREKYW